MECAICFELIGDAKSRDIVCGHRFHTSCLSTWIARCRTCPLCRQSVVFKGVQYDFLVYRIQRLLEEIASTSELEIREARLQKLYNMIEHHKLGDDVGITNLMRDIKRTH